MPNFLDALNPITGIISAASGILEKFIPNAEDKAKAQLELAQLQANMTLELAKLDAQNNATARDVIVAEAKSESWLARNWRPIAMMVFLFILAYDLILAQIFSLKYLPMDEHLWQLLTMGLGGYQFLRTGEKAWAKKVDGQVAIAKVNAKGAAAAKSGGAE